MVHVGDDYMYELAAEARHGQARMSGLELRDDERSEECPEE